MKRTYMAFALILAVALLFAGCGFLPEQAHAHNLTHMEGYEATCTVNGVVENWHCLECGKRFADAEATQEITFADIEIIAEHKYSEEGVVTAPTCTEAGYTSYPCTVCDDAWIDPDSKVDALGHTPGEDDGDCTTAVMCGVCGGVATPAKETHTPAEDDGDCSTAVTCADCEKTVTEAMSHTDENGDEKCDHAGCTYVFPDTSVKIYTAEELVAAFKNGGNYKLMNDLNMGETYVLSGKVEIKLNLGGYTLTFENANIEIASGATALLSDGTIKQLGENNEALCCRGTLVVSNCTLIGRNYYALYIIDGNVKVENSVLTGGVSVETGYNETATLVATDNVTVTAVEDEIASGVSVVSGGIAVFGFDPVSLYSGYNLGVATDNGDGTWTVKRPELTGDGSVVASYVEFSGDAVQQDGKTFTVTVPADVGFAMVTARVFGQNLNLIVENGLMDQLYRIGDGESNQVWITAAFSVVDAASIKYDRCYIYSSQIDTSPNPVYISNDGGETWIDTGYVVIVKYAE